MTLNITSQGERLFGDIDDNPQTARQEHLRGWLGD